MLLVVQQALALERPERRGPRFRLGQATASGPGIPTPQLGTGPLNQRDTSISTTRRRGIVHRREGYSPSRRHPPSPQSPFSSPFFAIHDLFPFGGTVVRPWYVVHHIPGHSSLLCPLPLPAAPSRRRRAAGRGRAVRDLRVPSDPVGYHVRRTKYPGRHDVTASPLLL